MHSIPDWAVWLLAHVYLVITAGVIFVVVALIIAAVLLFRPKK